MLIIVVAIAFIISSIFGFGMHWAIHQRWSGKLYRSHMTHHLILYPPYDFQSDVYRDAGNDRSTKLFAIGALPLILAPIIFYLLGWISIWLMIIALIIEGLIGFLHNYLHDAFHIHNHWLSKSFVKHWYNRLVALHYIHHIN